MRKAQQEREDRGYAVPRNWCVVCVRSLCVEKHLQVELLNEEEGRERTKLSMVTFNHVSVTQENADKFPILIRRDEGQSQTKVTCCERKSSISHLIPFLVDWRILFERREWTEYESIPRSDEPPHCERSEETIPNSQDFDWI